MNPHENRSRLQVLLIEDEPADAHLARFAFEEGRVRVDLHHVCDGVEAFAFLRRKAPYETAPMPDLILLDLNMPRMDGRQFLERIKNQSEFGAIPVVMLTTSDAETDIVSAYCGGVAGYIVKPLDVEEFIAKVRGISDYWSSVVRLPERT